MTRSGLMVVLVVAGSSAACGDGGSEAVGESGANGVGEASGLGGRTWWFGCSSVVTPGEYFVLDVDHNVRSYPFEISDQVYREVLRHAEMTRAAAGYVHYLHGLNALSLVYLTNTYRHGAENCSNEVFHTWFSDGRPQWDRVGVTTYGPAPGFLAGGPNPSYD